MTVAELIERLETEDPDALVLLAHQPSWPLQFDVSGVVSSEELIEEDEEEYGDTDYDTRGQEPGIEDHPPVVYIVEGGHPRDLSPYGPRAAWDHV